MQFDSHAMQNDLRQSHRKLTRPRQVIFDTIMRADQHLTPAEIRLKASSECPNVGLTTIYRTLDLLVELGYVRRIHLENGCHSYAVAARSHGHHLVCSSCGQAQEFADCDIEPLISILQSKTGYKIENHMLELIGRCPTCQD